MKKILLIITNNKTRQLYHEIFFSKGIEAIPMAELSISMVLMTLNKFDLAILDADQNPLETEIFLRLRQEHNSLSKTKLVILTKNINFNPQINKNDILINTSKISTEIIVKQIENKCGI